MAGGIDVLGVLSLFVVFFVWTCSPQVSLAQTTTTTTTFNASNVTQVCHTQCCDRPALQTEARLACYELRHWGMKDTDCILWQLNAVSSCKDSCSNCTSIAKAMYDQCLFFLQSSMEFSQAMEYCKKIGHDFEHSGRCGSVCNVSAEECHSAHGRQCMKQCGNYRNCECYQFRGAGKEPDICGGKTILLGYIPDSKPVKKYSCKDIGPKCKNHRNATETGCGKYKHCTQDMCLIKNISCPITDGCQLYGACETTTGECYYTLKDDGENCTDGLFYTHEDTCVKGKCTGWIDRCLRDDVKCGTQNPCLEPQGTCHPRSGACIFVDRPAGTPCPSNPGGVIDGTCQQGLCRRTVLDLCANKDCSSFGGDCFSTPTCDKLTGKCISVPHAEGMKCTDNRSDTFNDMCIEGQCIGSLYSNPMYQKIGAEGFCGDSQGRLLQRYFHDAEDESTCQEQCTRDPSCVAYSFGFHFCSIYGGSREIHPSPSLWGSFWKAGLLWGDSYEDNFQIGEYVRRRDTGKEWGFGYVTSLKPLKVTFEQHPQAESYRWDEVRKRGEAESTVEPLPNQQIVSCIKKVDWFQPETNEIPLSHEIAFGILMFMLISTPGFWYILIKCRSHHDDDDVEEVNEDNSKDAGEYDDLKPFKVHNEVAFAGYLNDDNPALSPRDNNPSAVAMAPPPPNEALEDEAVNEYQEIAGASAQAVDPGSPGPGSEVLDPRGQVQ